MSKPKQSIPAWRVLLVVFVFVGPIFMAIWLYHTRDDHAFSTSNYGELLQPLVPASTLKLVDAHQKPLALTNNDGIWHLLYLQENACTQDCQLNLEKLQTTRAALGRNIKWLANVVVISTDHLSSLTDLSETSLQTIQVATTDNNTIQQALTYSAGFLLVDPQGNIVMRYPHDAQGNGLLRDIRKLLRVSSHG